MQSVYNDTYKQVIHNGFSHNYENDVHNKPAKLLLLCNYVRQPMAAVFFKNVLNFQRQAVKDWNSHYNDVTLSYNMGFVGVREDSSDGAALVILDMLLKFGVLNYNNNNMWGLNWLAKLQRLYCFGDWKTIENSLAFVNKLSNRSLSFKESSIQAEIFLKAFSKVMFLPGNWHTGMNMLQSIYKLFWSDLLKPLKDVLGWKRIAKNVC
jgi:hypothetical protein